MKKILSLCVAAVAALTMTAQDIAVNIKLVAQSGGESTLLLASGNGVSSADNATLVAPLANTDNVAIYVQDDDRYSIFATDGAFVNLPVSFITDRTANQSYTLHFEDVLAGSGTGSLTIKDLVTGDLQTIVDGESYGPFVVNTTNAPGYVAGTNSVIANRFVINYDQSTYAVTSVTTNEDGWASFAYTADVAPADPSLAVYKGALNNSDPENPAIVLTAVTTGIPAGEGVFVHGAPLTTYNFSATTATAFSGNDLVGCTAATDPAGISDAIYTLRNVGGVTALYHYEGTAAIPAGKAYLPIPVGSNPAPQRVRMVINEAQGMENVKVESVKAEKFVENGQILIKRGNEVYNLQGQIVK